MSVVVHTIAPNDTAIIATLADWHFKEWEMPPERTINRLTSMNPADILFHLALLHQNQVVASGGLHVEVGLFREYPHYRSTGPWVAILYTHEMHRKKGLGQHLLQHIEQRASEMGYKKIFLYTSTAQHLYEQNGWKVIDSLMYKNAPNVVMSKDI